MVPCRTEEGRTKRKVRAPLLEAGFGVLSFWEQHGDYRIHNYHWDRACWGCEANFTAKHPTFIPRHKIQASLVCWATMSECARFGLSVDFSERDRYEINLLTEDIAYDNMLAVTEAN